MEQMFARCVHDLQAIKMQSGPEGWRHLDAYVQWAIFLPQRWVLSDVIREKEEQEIFLGRSARTKPATHSSTHSSARDASTDTDTNSTKSEETSLGPQKALIREVY